jgi:hypothetical protein
LRNPFKKDYVGFVYFVPATPLQAILMLLVCVPQCDTSFSYQIKQNKASRECKNLGKGISNLLTFLSLFVFLLLIPFHTWSNMLIAV